MTSEDPRIAQLLANRSSRAAATAAPVLATADEALAPKRRGCPPGPRPDRTPAVPDPVPATPDGEPAPGERWLHRDGEASLDCTVEIVGLDRPGIYKTRVLDGPYCDAPWKVERGHLVPIGGDVELPEAEAVQDIAVEPEPEPEPGTVPDIDLVADDDPEPADLPLAGAKRVAEKRRIVEALSKHGNNRRKAADEIGIGRMTLYNKMQKYGLMEPSEVSDMDHSRIPPASRARTPEPAPIDRGDAVNHPSHYNAHPSGVECIVVAEHFGFNLGNALKYIWRADHKANAVEDLKKAAFYLDREIARRERIEGS